jgi:hypothetical protein
VFDYSGCRIGVSTEHPDHLEWLAEFLTPSFAVVPVEERPHEPVDCETILSLDDDAFERQMAAGPDGESVVCFEMDTRVVRLPVWHTDSSERVAFDETERVFYYADARRRRIEVLAPTPSSASGALAVRLALMRAVREVAMHAAHAKEGVFLHAAGFALEGNGLIVAGPKRAGKSTLLLFALTATPAALLSNDRLLLERNDSGFLVRGLPTITTLRPNTLDFFPDIQRLLLESGFHTGVTISEAKRLSRKGGVRVAPAPDGRFGITNPQLCELTSSPAVEQVPARAVLFPRQRSETEVLELVEASKEKAVAQLRRSLFGPQDERPVDALFRLDSRPNGICRDSAKACRTLADAVPCYFCDVGPSSYERAASADALLGLLHDV